MNLVAIESLHDPRLLPLLEIWEQSFPPEEKVTAHWWIAFLQEKERAAFSRRHLIALEVEGEVIGMAFYENKGAEDAVAYLGYLAIKEGLRGKGAGAWFYAALWARMQNEGASVLVFETESPEERRGVSQEAEAIAQRRLNWYCRQGARRLKGVEYSIQAMGHPPLRLEIMVHCADAFSPETALEWAKIALGNDVGVIGTLELEG